MLPYIDEVPKTRSYIQEFRGYNHNRRILDTEFFDSYNVTNDDYPVISTRAERSIGELKDAQVVAAIGGERIGILYSRSDQLYFSYDGGELVFVGKYDRNLRYNLVRMGAYVICYPQAFAYNTVTGEVDLFSCGMTITDGIIVNCVKSDTGLIEVKQYSSTGRGKIGYYLVISENGEPGVRYSSNVTNYTDVDPENIYVKITGGALYNSKLYNFSFNLGEGVVIKCNENPDTIIEGDGWFAFPGIINQVSARIKNSSEVELTGVKNMTAVSDGEFYIRYATQGKSLDYIVECQNRLWACLYDGKRNEIFCTALGSYSDWDRLEASADAACVVPVGSEGDFTGAFTIGDTPVFFKENVIHKVYVSSDGAHRLYNINCRGIQKGSHASIAYVNESIIFKTKFDVVGFDGTNVTPISDALGHEYYSNAIAGAYKGKYVMWCKKGDDAYMFVYDLAKGLWQRELAPPGVIALVSDSDMLYLITEDEKISYSKRAGEMPEGDVSYMLESGLQGLSTPDGKYLVRLDYRVQLAFGASFNMWIDYDSNNRWISIGRIVGTKDAPSIETVHIIPRRCEHFKIRISGRGVMRLYGVQKIYEQGAEYGY